MATEELSLQIVTEGLSKFVSDMKSAEGAVSGAATGMSKAGNLAASAGASFQSFGKMALGAVVSGAALAATAIGGVAAAVVDLTIKAAPLEGIGDSFEAMASKYNVSLATMRESSAGTISDFELMRMANVALTGAGEDFGREFGEKLPNLLEAARAASRATGQDVDFLFNSLVTGIKRGSPLLIDNTGLVLSLGEANEAMAKSLGKSVDELTDEEKQIALLNATVAAGDKMVAQFGSEQQTAAEQIASFKASVQNAKDQIGLAFIPVLEMVMTPLNELATNILPVVVDAVMNFATHFGTLVEMLQGGVDVIDAVGFFLLRMGIPPEVVQSLKDFAVSVQEFIAQVIEAVAPIAEWIAQNVELQDILIVVGAAIATVVLPALWAFVAAAAPVIAVVTAAIAIVAALRAAWESDFMGIQTATTGILAAIWENISIVLDAIKAFWDQHGTAILAIATTVWEGIKTVITTVSDAVRAAWEAYLTAAQATTEVVWGAIQSAIEVATGLIQGILDAFALAAEGNWTGFGERLRAVWDEIWTGITTALSAAGTAILEAIGSLIDSIVNFFSTTDWGAVGSNIINSIASGISAGAGALVEAAKSAAQAALDAALGFLGGGGGGTYQKTGTPSYQHGGTPTGGNILVGDKGPELLTGVPSSSRVISSPTTSRMISQSSTTKNYNLTTQSMVRPGGLALEFASMEMGDR